MAGSTRSIIRAGRTRRLLHSLNVPSLCGVIPGLIGRAGVFTSSHPSICRFKRAGDIYDALDGSKTTICDQTQADNHHSWDDWVPQSRLRKYSEENLELAKMLKRELDNQRTQTKPATDKRASIVKKQGRDSSARISENLSPAPQVAAKKRGRDNETERVSCLHDETKIAIVVQI